MADGIELGRGYISVVPKLSNGSTKEYAKNFGDGLKGEGSKIGAKVGAGMAGSGTKVGKNYGSAILAAAKKYAAPLAGVFSVVAVKKFASTCTSSFTSLASSTKSLQRLMGGTATEVSEIAGAMRLSGMDTSKANASLTIFAKKMIAAQSGTASAASAFSSLGVSLKDANGNTKESGQLLEEVADKFAAMPDGATKTAAAVQLFGRSGTAMLPFLNKGSKGIEELKKKAEELGITIDEDGISKWSAYRGAVREWQVAIEGAKVTLGESFTPYITGAATVLTKTLVPAIQNIAKVVSEFFSGLTSAIDTAGFTEAFGGIGEAISDVFSSDKATTAKSVGAAIGNAINGLIPVINAAKPLVHGIASAIKFLGSVSTIAVPVIAAVGTGIFALKAASTLATAIKGVASGVSSIAGRAGAAAGGLTATAAAETAAGTAGATSATQILAAAAAVVALGAGVALAGAGMWLIANAAIALANAGGGAIAVAAGLIVVVAGLAVGAAVLGSALTVAAPGLVAFGAAILMIGAGIGIAAAGMALLASQIPILAAYGLQGAASLLALGVAALAVSPSFLALAVTALALSIPMVALAAGAIVAGTGLALAGVGAALLMVSLPTIAAQLPTVATALGVLAIAAAAVAPSILVLSAASLAAGAGLLLVGAGITLLTVGIPIVAAMLPIVAGAMTNLSTTAGTVAPAMAILAAAFVAASGPMLALAAGIVVASLGMSGFSAKSLLAAVAMTTLANNIPRIPSAALIAAKAISSLGSTLKSAVSPIKDGAEPIQQLAEHMQTLDDTSSDAAGSLGKISGYAAILAFAFRTISSTSVATTKAISTVGDVSAPAFKKLANEANTNIKNAEKTISECVKKIEDTIANAKLKFPQIDIGKLPHYRWLGNFDAKTNKVKALKVDWYAKGGIFDSASLVGVGEAGSEAVLPLNKKTLGAIGDGIANSSDNRQQNVVINLNYSADADANQMVMDIARGLRRLNLAGA